MDLRVTEGGELVSSPSLVAPPTQPTQEKVNGRCQDDETPASKASKHRLGQTLMLVGPTAKNQMPIKQELFTSVKDPCNRPGQCNLVLVDLRNLPRLGPSRVAPLLANQLACRCIAEAKPLSCRLCQVRFANAMRAGDENCQGWKLRERRITSESVRYRNDWGARNPLTTVAGSIGACGRRTCPSITA